MKIDKNKTKVKLDKKDIDKAFKSLPSLYGLLRTITIETYGEEIANIAFPKKENKHE